MTIGIAVPALCNDGQLLVDGNGDWDLISVKSETGLLLVEWNQIDPLTGQIIIDLGTGQPRLPDLNRLDCGGTRVQVSAVKEITIESGSGSDRIDLRQVTRANGFQKLDGQIELNGQRDNDTIIGSEFADRIYGHRDAPGVGGTDVDHLEGGPGDDVYGFDDPGGGNNLGEDDIIELLNDGNDTLDFTATGRAVNISLAIGGPSASDWQVAVRDAANNPWLQIRLNLTNVIENIYAPRDVATNDTLTGNTLNNIIHGYGGNDTIDGDGGDDRLEGGNGTDTIHGGTGVDVVNGGDGADTLFGDDGNDYVNGDGFADAVASANMLASPTNTNGNTWRFPVSSLVTGTLNVSLAPDRTPRRDRADFATAA